MLRVHLGPPSRPHVVVDLALRPAHIAEVRRLVPAQDLATVPALLVVVDSNAHDACVRAPRGLLRVLALEAELCDQHGIERRDVRSVRDDENALLLRFRGGF